MTRCDYSDLPVESCGHCQGTPEIAEKPLGVPQVDDVVTNGYDRGEVLRVTPSWVLVQSSERGAERWVHADEFDAGRWWMDA